MPGLTSPSVHRFRVLFAMGLRLALTGGRAGEARPEEGDRHFLGASYALTFSTLLAWILHGRAAPGQFLFVIFSFSMLFSAFAMLNALSEGLFLARDLEVTGHLPVPPSTRILARLAEQGVLLAFLVLDFHLTPAVFFGFMTCSPAGFLLVLAAGGCAALFVFAAGLFIYLAAVRLLGTFRLQGALLYLNVAFTLGVLGLAVNTGRLLSSHILRAAAAGAWPGALPPGWFAGAVLHGLGLPSARGGLDLRLAAAGTAAAVGFLLVLARAGSGSLYPAARGTAAGGGHAVPGLCMRCFTRLFVPRSARGAFLFAAVNLARDRGFRRRAYPLLGLPLLVLGLSLLDRKDPLFFILMLHLQNLYLLLVTAFLPFSDTFRGAWVFHALPVPSPRVFAEGVEKAFVFRLGIPLMVLNALVLSLLMSPLKGTLHAACALLAGLFPAAAAIRRMRDYPFSREFRGSVPQLFSGLVGLSFVVLFLTAMIQFALQAASAALAFLCLLLLLLHKGRLATERRLLRRAGAECVPPETEEASPAQEGPAGEAGRASPLREILRSYALLYGIFMLAALVIAGFSGGG